MDYQAISVQLQNGVATVTLNRPEVMNALSSQMRREITQAVTKPPTGTRCIVLTGTGRAFCSGQDLTDAAAAADLEGTLRDEYEPMILAIRNSDVPVIAAVNGVAAGAGANLALAADVVIAAESASFVQAFSRIGLMPDAGGTHVLPRLIGQARAMGAMLFADKVSATDAAQWGMIWQAVPDDAFEAVVAKRALTLAQGPTAAYRAIRRALADAAKNDFETQLKLEAVLQGELGKTHDFAEGVAAFLEKRPPQYRGN